MKCRQCKSEKLFQIEGPHVHQNMLAPGDMVVIEGNGVEKYICGDCGEEMITFYRMGPLLQKLQDEGPTLGRAIIVDWNV